MKEENSRSKSMKGKQNALKGDKPRDTQLQIRVSTKDKDRWARAAKKKGQSLTDYVTDILNNA